MIELKISRNFRKCINFSRVNLRITAVLDKVVEKVVEKVVSIRVDIADEVVGRVVDEVLERVRSPYLGDMEFSIFVDIIDEVVQPP